jgi:hypothetical protein
MWEQYRHHPLEWGHGPSRFNDGTGSFATLYAAEAVETAFPRLIIPSGFGSS